MVLLGQFYEGPIVYEQKWPKWAKMVYQLKFFAIFVTFLQNHSVRNNWSRHRSNIEHIKSLEWLECSFMKLKFPDKNDQVADITDERYKDSKSKKTTRLAKEAEKKDG